jgi:MFS family permease
MTPDRLDLDPRAGTVRLWVAVPAAVIAFVYQSVHEYTLPLYFGALGDVAAAHGASYPPDVWSAFVKYQVTAWIVGPFLAGLMARRYGECAVWSAAMLGEAIVPLVLAIDPDPRMVKVLALWQGITGSLMWIALVSLIQMVPPERKGLSNGLMMASMGLGSIAGPLSGRALIYRQELGRFLAGGDWSGLTLRLFSFAPTTSKPGVADFRLIFWLLTGVTVVCALVIGLWGQRPGRFDKGGSPDWTQTLGDLSRLARSPRFWALVLALCVLGGPVFQASNQFLPYRAEDVGLKSGAEDHGWIWLQLLKTLMWIPGGLAVGLLAGRRAPGIAAVLMLGCFSLAALGIGCSSIAWQLFAGVAVFEFVRQFMRWSHAGYLSEHMPDDLRATAIGCSVTFAGLGSTIYGWASDSLWSPNAADFQSWRPFIAAAVLGLAGSAGLCLFDHLIPIRERSPSIQKADPSLVSVDSSNAGVP